MIKLMYSVFLGLTIVMFVGVGVATFYSSPVEPDYIEENISFVNGEPVPIEEDAEMKEVREQYDKDRDVYDEAMQNYSRNVAIITMVLATVLLVISVTQAEKLAAIGEGVMLGGIFTLLYSLIWGLMSGDDIVRFLVVTVGLLVALWLGKQKFTPDSKKKAGAKK